MFFFIYITKLVNILRILLVTEFGRIDMSGPFQNRKIRLFALPIVCSLDPWSLLQLTNDENVKKFDKISTHQLCSFQTFESG